MRIERAVRGASIIALALSAGALLAQGMNTPAAPAGPAAPNSGVKVQTRPYDIAALVKPHGLPDNVYRGRAIFMQRCAYCHDGVGQPSYNTLGPFLDPDLLAPIGDAGVRMFITQGTDNMPGFQYALTPAQIDDVVAYVKTIPSSAKPTEDQLAGRLPGQKGPVGQGGGD
jgi:mono/diheme cytochrome c family protein